MRSILIILTLVVGSALSFSQETEVLSKEELKSIAKEEKMARKMAEREQMRNLTEKMLDGQRFVLEANYVGNGRGERRPANSTLNFIAIDSTKGTIQLGSSYGIGYNGVGGITVDGRITKYKLRKTERKRGNSYTLMINVMTGMGTFDITLMISETGFADATVRGNRSGQLRYSGNIVPIGVSEVYKGTTIY